MKNPIRNETSLVLVVAVIFSAIAIPVLSGFLEPSQPPAVAAVKIGEPSDGDGEAARDEGAPAIESGGSKPRPADDDVQAKRRRPAPRRAAPAPPAQSAPDPAEDDGGED